MSRVRVSTDGARHSVSDAETGKPIPGVKSARVVIEAGEAAKVELECEFVEGEFCGEAVYFIAHPITGKLSPMKSVTFADGEVIEF